MNSNKRNARIAMRRKAGYSLDEIMSEYEYITGHKCDEDTALEIKSIVESSGAYLSEVIEEYATLSCEGRLALVAQNRRSALNKKAGYYGPYVVDTPVGQLNAYIDDEEGVWSWMVDAGDGSLWDFDSHGFDTFEEAKADLFGKYVVLSERDAKKTAKWGDFREPRYVQTGLYGPKNNDILNSVIGQMSDGYYENDPYWKRYWDYCRISDDNEIIVEDGDWSSGFRGMSDSEVCHLFAKVIRNVMNRVFRDEWDDVPKSEFPVSQERCVYFDYDSGATYADVYNAMQELKNK